MNPRHTLVLACALALALASGCASRGGALAIDAVQPPGASVSSTGITDIGASGGVYEDVNLRITWTWSGSALDFDLLNKSSGPMRLVWDDAAMTIHGVHTYRVTHDGVRFRDRYNPQPPTTIPQGARLADFLRPVDYVRFTDPVTQPVGVRAKPLFRRNSIPMTLDVLLPLEINGARSDYRFRFDWTPAP